MIRANAKSKAIDNAIRDIGDKAIGDIARTISKAVDKVLRAEI